MADAAPISFDDAGHVRILDADALAHAQELQRESREFVQRIREFDQTVRDIVENLNGESKIVEAAKLRAIGQRNLVQAEMEMRQRRTKELHDLLADKTAELARINAECESLSRIETQQKDMIDKLSNSEAPAF